MVLSTRPGLRPMCSMMSSSPLAGHSPCVPSIQIAGHVPRPQGSLARISKKPVVHSARPRVNRRGGGGFLLPAPVAGVGARLLARRDDEPAVAHHRVPGARAGVVLRLVVEPA